MDIFDSPEIKKKYDKCKLVVKIWEHKFKKKFGRVPSKLDIKEADKETRYAYKTYFDIKSAMLEKSLHDVDGFFSDEDTQDKSTELADNDTSSFTESLSENFDSNNIQEQTNEIMTLVESNNKSVDPMPTKMLDGDSLERVNPVNTWGEHLNKAFEKPLAPKEEKKMVVNTNFTKKLFSGSKFSKRNPRKSLSFVHRRSDSNLERPMFLSQPETNSSCSFAEPPVSGCNDESSIDGTEIFKNKIKVVTASQPDRSLATNVFYDFSDNNKKSLRMVDNGWLQRITSSAGTDLADENVETITNQSNIATTQRSSFPQLKTRDFKSVVDDANDNNLAAPSKVDFDSDDIIDESDEEDQSQSNRHIAKKRKLSELSLSQPCRSTMATQFNKNIESKQLNFSNIFTKTGSNVETNKNDEMENVKTNLVPVEETLPTIEESKVVLPTKRNKASNPKTNQKRKTSKKASENADQVPTPARKSARQKKALVALDISSGSEQDPFHTDNDSDDPEFNIISEKDTLNTHVENDMVEPKTKRIQPIKRNSASKKERKSKTLTKKHKKEKAHIEGENEGTYELEFSIMPRVKTVPRFNDLKNVVRFKHKTIKTKAPNKATKIENKVVEDTSCKSNREMEKEKFEKKIASGNLNENFVQINLQKKIYVRGKRNMNFSKYKKQQWKNIRKAKALCGPDMDMGGCDGGMLTCFKCGKIGHFARNCKENKGDGLLPLDVEEEVCPYPTLEEAAELAKDDRFTIRIPKMSSSNFKEDDNNFVDENEQNKLDEENRTENTNNELKFDDDFDDMDILAETLRLEEYAKQIDIKEYLDKVNIVKPYYEVKDNGTLKDTPKEVFEALKMFGHTSFREGQEKAIMRILSGQSTLVTLSTGSGKSLCYQLPAYLYSKREPCISLVISPLVSLMEDQVTGIPSLLRAACLHTNQTKPHKDKVMEALSSGELSILLISPEAVVAGEKSTGFGSLLRKLPPIAFACIDEAHCVSQWSHNFRPSYLMICRILRERLGVKTILGLTATATRATSDSIIEHLQIPDGRGGIISDRPLPNNLRLTVSKDVNKDSALLSLLMSEQFSNFKSIIIYCIRREECERIAAFLRTSLKFEKQPEVQNKKRKRLNVQAEPYHAGLAASRRRTIQKAFMSNELRIVVATVAFGMGINKSDLRAVIHYNMPKNVESYVQEVGRAGRDGLQAHCHLFLDSQGRDENELRRHIYANSIDRHVIRKLLQKIFVPCSCKVGCPRHEVAFSIDDTVRALDIPEENISTLLCYLELHENRYIEVLSSAYTICKVISYGGPMQIRKAAKECPPLAMALALHKQEDENVLEFPVIDVASTIGWDSGICKHKLKNLEWITVNNQPKRSTLSVKFSNLGFRLLAPGNLSGIQLDEALDSLYERVVDQETTALLQLHSLHVALTSVAVPTYKSCLAENISEEELLLKEKIRQYFESPKPLDLLPPVKEKPINEEQIANNVRALVYMYRDNVFTGRAVARIFHGIQSPNFPAVIWGRCKFWRAHMSEDFNAICRVATKEILKMR